MRKLFKAITILAAVAAVSAACGLMACDSESSGGSTQTTSTSSDGITYTIYDTYCAVTDYNNSQATVVIPSAYNDLPVTYIGNNAFQNCTSLTSVTISSSVTHIDEYAFQGCTNLASVTIPDSVTSIGTYAFCECSALTSVTIPENVTYLGGGAFYHCYALTQFNFNAAVMDNVTSASYQSVLSSAGEKSGGITVNIGANVTKIPAYLFSGAYYITSVNFASGSVCKSIGVEAFSYCTSLTDITIPDSVTSISGNAFENCTSLISVTIGSGVEEIGTKAFYGCYKLIEVKDLSSLTITAGSTDNGYVGYYAKNVYTSTSGSSNLITQDNYIFYNDGSTYYLMGYTGSGTELMLPTTVNGGTANYAIYQYAFYGNTTITSITIGSSVTSIGNYAFYGCSSLTSVTFENTSGWYVTTTSGATNGTDVTLTDTETNATYLTSTYISYYWYYINS